MDCLNIDFDIVRQKYRKWLFDDFLPFMDKYIIDKEYGGFMCEADMNGKLLSTNKNSWYIGRGIWVYSFLYNNLTREPEHLEIAEKALKFILSVQPGDGLLWHSEFTRDGKPVAGGIKGVLIGGRYVDVGDQVYGDLFIAEALAEYSKACGREDYRAMAKKIIQKCVAIYDNPQYSPSAARVYMNSQSDLPGARLLGVWMLLMRVCTQMLRINDDCEISHIADRCIDAVLNHHYNSEYGLLNEVLNHDFSRPDNEYRDMVYTGHAIETLWMLMDEALRRNDKPLLKRAVELFKRHLEVSWDDVYKGYFRCLTDVYENKWVLDKAGWLQEEAMIGLLTVIKHTDAKWAYRWFEKTLHYIENSVSLEKYGSALWNPWAQRQGGFNGDIKRIENYHHPRHLMLNILLMR